MNGRLPASWAILEDRNAILRDFQKANRSGYARALEAGGDGSSNFLESSGRECDDARPCAAQRQTEQTRHLRYGKHFGQSRNEFLPVLLMQAVLHRVPDQVVAAGLDGGNEKGRALEIPHGIITRNLGG